MLENLPKNGGNLVQKNEYQKQWWLILLSLALITVITPVQSSRASEQVAVSTQSVSGTPTAAVGQLSTAATASSTQPGGSGQPMSNPHPSVQAIALYPAYVVDDGVCKWGYVNEQGKFAIKPVFDSVENFETNGLAVVTVDDQSGVIDGTGKFIVEPTYGYLRFSGNRIVASTESGYAVFDSKGQVVFKTTGFVGSFSEGKAYVCQPDKSGNSRYGYIDQNGKIIIQPVYAEANDFHDGKALVQLVNGAFVLIDQTGKIVGTFKYPKVSSYSEHLLVFKNKDSEYLGYLDEKGVVVVKPQFGEAWEFKNGLAVVNPSLEFEPTFGVINSKGQYVIEPKYNQIRQFANGYLAVGKPLDPENPENGSIFAIADKTGKFLTDFLYYDLTEYQDGVISVTDETSTFFLDENGKKVSTLPTVKGFGSLTVRGNLVQGNIDAFDILLDRRGKVIWQAPMEFLLKNGLTIKTVKYRPNRTVNVRYPELSGLRNQTVQQAINKRLADEFLAVVQAPSNDENFGGAIGQDSTYDADFTYGFCNKAILVLGREDYTFPFGAAHGMPTKQYYHIDLQTGKFYELKDLFKKGSNYLGSLNAILQKQVKTNGEEMGVWVDEFTGISQDPLFILEKDCLKIYFSPYEIAPYAAGFPTFTIKYAEVMKLIDTNGALWKAITAK